MVALSAPGSAKMTPAKHVLVEQRSATFEPFVTWRTEAAGNPGKDAMSREALNFVPLEVSSAHTSGAEPLTKRPRLRSRSSVLPTAHVQG